MTLEMWDDDDDDFDEYKEEADPIDFGPCCVCGKEDATVRNIMMLNKRTPAGYGWGCLQCDLPMEGAIAVICDECLVPDVVIKEYVFGQVSDKKRALVSTLSDEVFDHDMTKHPEGPP
jgi:hypothetical protein